MVKILVVDDSDILRMDLKNVLEGGGHEVIEAADGKKGLQAATADPSIELIITDLNMPEMDGISMIKNIRESGVHEKTPAFMLTTESSRDLRNAGREVGIMLWIVKPFNGEKVLGAIEKVMERVRAAS